MDGSELWSLVGWYGSKIWSWVDRHEWIKDIELG